VEEEKARVYAPLKRKDGMEWKELNAGIGRIMQDYCGEFKSEESLKIGLTRLNSCICTETLPVSVPKRVKLLRRTMPEFTDTEAPLAFAS
jgi:hypothetical protein